MTTRVLRTPADIDAAKRLLDSRKLPLTVTITAGANRTHEQNHLQRKWCLEAAQQLGDRTEEEVRGDCKLRFGVPILRADNEVFAEKYDRLIRPFPYKIKLEFMMVPLDFPVTRLMNVRQKSAYLDRMCRELSAMGVVLTIPEEKP